MVFSKKQVCITVLLMLAIAFVCGQGMAQEPKLTEETQVSQEALAPEDAQVSEDLLAKAAALKERVGLLEKELSVLQEKKELLLIHKKFVVQIEEVDVIMARLAEEIGSVNQELADIEAKQALEAAAMAPPATMPEEPAFLEQAVTGGSPLGD